jgi:hypothetical protein
MKKRLVLSDRARLKIRGVNGMLSGEKKGVFPDDNARRMLYVQIMSDQARES